LIDLVISRAHAENDPGVLEPSSGRTEYGFAGEVGDTIALVLAANGVAVSMIDAGSEYPTGQEALAAKVRTINKMHREQGGVALAIEVHLDSRPDPRSKGPECHVWRGNPATKRIAWAITDELARLRQLVPRAPICHPAEGYPRNYFVRKTACPAILVEVGAVTNSQDAHWIGSEYAPHETGIAIARAVMRWIRDERGIRNHDLTVEV